MRGWCGDLRGMRVQLVVHASLAILVRAAIALATVKPRGMTRYGQRRAREDSSASHTARISRVARSR